MVYFWTDIETGKTEFKHCWKNIHFELNTTAGNSHLLKIKLSA